MNHQGDALRSLLKKEGVTLSELARRLHVHPNTITNYVQSSEIKLDVWRQISTVLKLELGELMPSLQPLHSTEPASNAESAASYALANSKVPKTLTSCQEELLRTQAAYINLLQEHLDLVRRTTPTNNA